MAPCARALGRAVEELQLAAGADAIAPELRAALLAALVEVARLAGVAEWQAEDLAAPPTLAPPRRAVARSRGTNPAS